VQSAFARKTRTENFGGTYPERNMSSTPKATGPPPGTRSSPRIKSIQQLKAAKKAEMLRAQMNASLVENDSRETEVRKGTGLAYHEDMLCHACPWDEHHIESPGRLKSIWARCNQLDLVDRCVRVQCREATNKELLLYHTEEFIKTFAKSKNQEVEEIESICRQFDSVYMCKDTDRAARLAVGGSLELVEKVIAGDIHNGMGLVRPPGHHAMGDTQCGFCGFNNVVIAAKSALEQGVKKILIVDFDLHHGQGTQYAFYSDPRVVYMSVHRYEKGRYWPHLRESNCDWIGEGEGKGFNVNVPLNTVGCGPADYLAIFHSVFLPIATEFQPGLVLVSAGYDAAVGCPEGEMMVTPATYAHLIWSLTSFSMGRLVVLLEGGYCLPSLAESAALTLRCLQGLPCPLVGEGTVKESVMESIRGVVTALRPYWNCLKVWKVVEVATTMYPGSSPVFKPDLSFKPPPGWPPAAFPTKDYYLVYDDKTAAYWDMEVARLVLNTNLVKVVNKLCLVYDQEMEKHCDDEPHPECPDRTRRIWAALTEAGVVGRGGVMKLENGRQLSKEEALLVHDEDHWEKLMESDNMDQEEREEWAESLNSIYLNSSSVKCGLLAAGGVLACVDQVMSGSSVAGLAVVRPPGHHAEPDTPHGFCLFNNVGIAAQYAVTQLGVDKVLILDWDVHHGNGIQHMFYNSNKVLYISLHRYDYGGFFPQSSDANYDMVGEGAGKGFNVNIPWNGRKMGDSEYFLGFNNIVLPIAYEFQPQLILISAGFDAAEGDPLGGYKVTPAMYGYMTHQLSSLAEGRIVVALEGGYNLGSISDCATQCARALLGDPLPVIKVGEAKDSAIQTIRDVIKEHNEFWSCLTKHNKLLPLEIDNEASDVNEDNGLLDQLQQLNLGTNRSVVRSALVTSGDAAIGVNITANDSAVMSNCDVASTCRPMETEETSKVCLDLNKSENDSMPPRLAIPISVPSCPTLPTLASSTPTQPTPSDLTI